MQKKLIMTGIFLSILVLSIALLLIGSLDSPDSCPPPPTSVFWLVNEDPDKSHFVSVIINDASNTTLAIESYNLAPRERAKSELMMTSEDTMTTNQYYLIFTVDNSTNSKIPVEVSYYSVPELHVDPVKKEVEFYSNALTGDYACRAE